MKVVTFNTYCAPTMPHRLKRVNDINRQIKEFYDDGVDTVCLQECNSYRTGIFGYLLLKLIPFVKFDIFIQAIEILAYLEGLLFPWYEYDPIAESILEQSKKIGYSYVCRSFHNRKGVTSGLIILSKHCIIDHHHIYFEPDLYHNPGALFATIEYDNIKILVINCHLMQTLDPISLKYILVRYSNKLCGFKTDEMRFRSFETIKRFINDYKSKNRCHGIIVLGDFNLHRLHEQYDRMLDLYEEHCIRNTANNEYQDTVWENVGKQHVIDYILSDIENGETVVLSECQISDHYPLQGEFKVSVKN